MSNKPQPYDGCHLRSASVGVKCVNRPGSRLPGLALESRLQAVNSLQVLTTTTTWPPGHLATWPPNAHANQIEPQIVLPPVALAHFAHFV